MEDKGGGVGDRYSSHLAKRILFTGQNGVQGQLHLGGPIGDVEQARASQSPLKLERAAKGWRDVELLDGVPNNGSPCIGSSVLND